MFNKSRFKSPTKVNTDIYNGDLKLWFSSLVILLYAKSSLNASLNYLINFNTASVLLLTLFRVDPYRHPTPRGFCCTQSKLKKNILSSMYSILFTPVVSLLRYQCELHTFSLVIQILRNVSWDKLMQLLSAGDTCLFIFWDLMQWHILKCPNPFLG